MQVPDDLAEQISKSKPNEDTAGATTFVYALRDGWTKEVRYIGVSDDPHRGYLRHLRAAKDPAARTTPKTAWIRSELEAGRTPDLVILEEVSSSSWREAEARWLARAKDSGSRLLRSGGAQGRGRLKGSRAITLLLDPETHARYRLAVEQAGVDFRGEFRDFVEGFVATILGDDTGVRGGSCSMCRLPGAFFFDRYDKRYLCSSCAGKLDAGGWQRAKEGGRRGDPT